MKPIDFHPAAAAELRDAADWYAGIRSTLEDDFRSEVEAALSRIASNPQMYGVERGSLRIAPLHRFPYSVVYEELDDRIWIAAVSHQSRRPGYWLRRRR